MMVFEFARAALAVFLTVICGVLAVFLSLLFFGSALIVAFGIGLFALIHRLWNVIVRGCYS